MDHNQLDLFSGSWGSELSFGIEEIDQAFPKRGMRTRQLGLLIGKSGTGKTYLGLELCAHVAQTTPVLYLTLEQSLKQIQIVTARLLRNISTDEAKELVTHKSSYLDDMYEGRFQIATGFFTEEPDGIEKIIASQTFAPRLVVVDHLGLIETSPSNIDPYEEARAVQKLYEICKRQDCCLIVLKNLPKEVPAGVEFSYEAGRNGSTSTDYCDYVFCTWRPDHEQGISDQEALARSGQYYLKIGKNRHGPQAKAFLHRDMKTMRTRARY